MSALVKGWAAGLSSTCRLSFRLSRRLSLHHTKHLRMRLVLTHILIQWIMLTYPPQYKKNYHRLQNKQNKQLTITTPQNAPKTQVIKTIS